MNNIAVSTATAHVLNLVLGGALDENEVRRQLAAEADGRAILASDVRAPGRQLDALAAHGLIAFVNDEAVVVMAKLQTTVLTVL